MPDLTIQQQYGASATLNGGILSITLSEIGLDTLNPTTSQIDGAILLRRKSLLPADATNDPTIGTTIGDPFAGIATRGEVQQIEQQYSVSLYKTAGDLSISDPDQILGQ